MNLKCCQLSHRHPNSMGLWFHKQTRDLVFQFCCNDTCYPKPRRLSSYQKYDKEHSINAFGRNTVKGEGEGDIDADIEYGGKITRIHLTRVMHIPKAKGKILSLKVLAQKGLKSCILLDQIQITKDNKTYTEALLGGEIDEAKMRVIPPQENILSAVKRDSPAAVAPEARASW